MQRTVREFTITMPSIVEKNGNYIVETTLCSIREYDEKKAIKKAQKMLNSKAVPLKVEYLDTIYYLDDEVFFKYATTIKPND